MPTFEIKAPVGANQAWMAQQIRDAIAEATRRGKLRPNSVDSITGKNSGNNLGPGTPVIHFEQWDQDEVEVKLLLKGGGCENTNIQYSVPCELPQLGRADRDLDGVRKCSCTRSGRRRERAAAPGAIGVCIGGDRASGYAQAKQQLFRSLDDVNPDPRSWPNSRPAVMKTVNVLGIGTMGFGGADIADRLQGGRAEPAAGELLRFRRLRLLGLPPSRCRARREGRLDPALALSRPLHARPSPCWTRRFHADRPRGGADGASHRGSQVRSLEVRRRGSAERDDVHRAATRCIRI